MGFRPTGLYQQLFSLRVKALGRSWVAPHRAGREAEAPLCQWEQGPVSGRQVRTVCWGAETPRLGARPQETVLEASLEVSPNLHALFTTARAGNVQTSSAENSARKSWVSAGRRAA